MAGTSMEEDAAQRCRNLFLIVFYVALMAFLSPLLINGNPPSEKTYIKDIGDLNDLADGQSDGDSGSKYPNFELCQETIKNDKLTNLTFREPDAAKEQLARWNACDPKILEAAKAAVYRDFGLILLLVLMFVASFVHCNWRDERRLHRVAFSALYFAFLYALADLLENGMLLKGLNGGAFPWQLRWVAATKFGAFLGALPLLLLSFGLAVGKYRELSPEPPVDPELPVEGGRRGRIKQLLEVVRQEMRRAWQCRQQLTNTLKGLLILRQRAPLDARTRSLGQIDSTDSGREVQIFYSAARRLARILGSVQPAPAPPPDPLAKKGLGICCSGGGIRSAAFNLGALQAMDDASEYCKAEWISAVSGGSYMAAAWVSSRITVLPVPPSDATSEISEPAPEPTVGPPVPPGTPIPRAWGRLSLEESHLRRHASYLAPNLVGKIWALSRYLFGFVLTLGLFALATGVLLLPFGWAIEEFWQESMPPPRGGSIELDRGGRLQLSDGTQLIASRETKLRLSGRELLRLKVKEPVGAAAEDPADANAILSLSSGEDSVKADVTGVGMADATVDRGLTGSVKGSISIGPAIRPDPAGTSSQGLAPKSIASKLRADTDGRIIKKGETVELQLGPPLHVYAEEFDGCPMGTLIRCPKTKAQHYVPPSGTRLIEAFSNATLTLDGPAIVTKDGALARACGSKECEKVKTPVGVAWPMRAFGALITVVAFATLLSKPKTVNARGAEKFLKFALPLLLTLSFIFYALPLIIHWVETQRLTFSANAARVGGGGAVLALTTLATQVLPFVSGSSKRKADGTSSWTSKILEKLRPLLIQTAGLLAGPFVLLAIAAAFGGWAAHRGLIPLQWLVFLAMLGALLFIHFVGDLNEWSFHPFYRDRLRTAFAADLSKSPPGERPDPLLDQVGGSTEEREPKLLICAAANIADPQVTAPGRPVSSWTFEEGDFVARKLVRPPEPGEVDPPRGRITARHLPCHLRHLDSLWTSVAVSGAAFSPAMGKLTRSERFIMALGNVRLGVWYPNPIYANSKGHLESWYLTHHPTPRYLVKEAIGRHKVKDRWIYVTDGGHYENLGLVELLRKGCRDIYCFDASGDAPGTLGTLADAMRLARAQMGIEIKITNLEKLKPNDEGISEAGVWAGTIEFPKKDGESEAAVGWLVIAKLAVPKNAPFDILDLARSLPSFPNHSTLDQLFTDQKFEAYRALGHFLGGQAIDLAKKIRLLSAIGPGNTPAERMRNAVQDALKNMYPEEEKAKTTCCCPNENDPKERVPPEEEEKP